jgi:hypothetical protein
MLKTSLKTSFDHLVKKIEIAFSKAPAWLESKCVMSIIQVVFCGCAAKKGIVRFVPAGSYLPPHKKESETRKKKKKT